MKLRRTEIVADDGQQRRKISRFILWIIGVSAICLVSSAAVYWYMLHHNGVSSDPAHWGQMGDYFGGVLNPLLAFFSLLTICYTLALQIEESAKTTRFNAVQKFESMLFEMIRMHRDNLASVDLWSKGQNGQSRETNGRDCLLIFLKWIRKNFETVKHGKTIEAACVEAYRIFYEDRGRKTEVGHYFRNLYHIFKYIDASQLLSDAEKMHYAKIVRAQLSVPEVALLFLNGLHPRGKNFREYIIKYSLLQDLDASDLNFTGLTQKEMVGVYAQSAFGDSDMPIAGSKGS